MLLNSGFIFYSNGCLQDCLHCLCNLQKKAEIIESLQLPFGTKKDSAHVQVPIHHMLLVGWYVVACQ